MRRESGTCTTASDAPSPTHYTPGLLRRKSIAFTASLRAKSSTLTWVNHTLSTAKPLWSFCAEIHAPTITSVPVRGVSPRASLFLLMRVMCCQLLSLHRYRVLLLTSLAHSPPCEDSRQPQGHTHHSLHREPIRLQHECYSRHRLTMAVIMKWEKRHS